MIKLSLSKRGKQLVQRVKDWFIRTQIKLIQATNWYIKFSRDYDCQHGIHSNPQWVSGYNYFYGVCQYCNNKITPDHGIDTRYSDCPCPCRVNGAGSLYKKLVNKYNNHNVLIKIIEQAVAGIWRG